MDTVVTLLPQNLPGASQRLTIHYGDVTEATALAKSIKGCEQLVHLAAVVDLLTPKTEPEKERMLATALQGTRIVLGKVWGCSGGCCAD